MSPVSPVFHTVVTVKIGFKNSIRMGTSITLDFLFLSLALCLRQGYFGPCNPQLSLDNVEQN